MIFTQRLPEAAEKGKHPLDEGCGSSKGEVSMKTMVMTGGTGGIGLVAAEQWRERRRFAPSRRAWPSALRVGSLPLDLMRLASVRNFAAAVEQWLGDTRIDGLVLNAGTQVRDIDQRTEDGFEPTFAVNHLAHYLLLRLLSPRLAPARLWRSRRATSTIQAPIPSRRRSTRR